MNTTGVGTMPETAVASGKSEEFGYTFCGGCNEVPFCGIRFTRRGDIITQVEPWPGYPAGPLCSKGYATLQRLYNPDRLTYPAAALSRNV